MSSSRDAECVAFLQWALPRLGFRWKGFRKVRRQVCRRVRRRAGELGLDGLDAYRVHLLGYPAEWTYLAACCRVTISRFYRDRGVFDALRRSVLPELARRANGQGTSVLRVWSAGCASGEEPLSVFLAWELDVGRAFPATNLDVVASDADPYMLERARRAVYPASALRELPVGWRAEAFTSATDGFALRDCYRDRIELRCEDVEGAGVDGPFDAVFCRNLAFTYFDAARQRAFLDLLLDRLVDGGALVVGCHERLPESAWLVPWPETSAIYRKI